MSHLCAALGVHNVVCLCTSCSAAIVTCQQRCSLGGPAALLPRCMHALAAAFEAAVSVRLSPGQRCWAATGGALMAAQGSCCARCSISHCGHRTTCAKVPPPNSMHCLRHRADPALHRGWESAARGAELEMTGVVHEEGEPCDDDCSPYAPRAATQESALGSRALTPPGGAATELPRGPTRGGQPPGPEGAVQRQQEEAAEAAAGGSQEVSAASAGAAATESALPTSGADGASLSSAAAAASSSDQASSSGDAVALRMASVSSHASSALEGDGPAAAAAGLPEHTAAAPAAEQLLA
jgi:hypothetical protein